MPHPAVRGISRSRGAPWLRRAIALAGAGGLVCLQAVAPATALTRPAAAAPGTVVSGTAGPAGQAGTAASGGGSSVTVPGPAMYNPKTKSSYPGKSSVTVSQTANLVGQFVTVSWTGFTPTNTQGAGKNYNPYDLYPVEIAQCSSVAPTSPQQCYGAMSATQATSGGPGTAGPTTEDYALTGKAVSSTQGGSGTAQFQIQTGVQNTPLGCDSGHECSLLVLPVDGGNPGGPSQTPDCSNHKTDEQWATENSIWSIGYSYYYCAWQDRIVIPLHFAPTSAFCQFSTPDFTVVGSPMMERAMTSWIGKLCAGTQPVHFSFEGTVNEPQARSDFLSGADDVALTTDPASGPAVGRTYTYAPVGISAEAVAYWMDNPRTGQPYTGLELTPRLMAKLLTTSYNFNFYGCTPQDVKNPPQPPGCNDAVDHNPEDLFADPDFRALNPGIKAASTPLYSDFPTVLSGNSDMTYELTRWMAANPATVSFLDGTPDPWGMRVNVNYLNLQLPEEQLSTQDPFQVWTLQYSPQFPLAKVSTYQVDNYSPGVTYNPPGCPPPCTATYTPNPIENPGTRDLIAILDEPDVVAYDLPTAALENYEGKYVTPSAASMTAAVGDMTVNPDGITRDDSEVATNPAAYPLTMVVYAMVPTSGITKAKAAKIAQWLDYVGGAGQDQGTGAGQLPPGYLPLPGSMKAQTLKAAYDVLHQTGAKPPGGYHSTGGSGGGGTSGSGGGASTGSSRTSPSSSSPGKGTSTTTPSAAKVNAAYSSPDSAGFIRWVLPILLVIGALLALAGPSAVVLSRPGGRAALVAGWRRVTKLGSRLGRKP